MPRKEVIMTRRDIRLASDEVKRETYELIDGLYEMGIPVSVKAHKSGFPAVTVDCGEVHILTDILSIEEWWNEKRKDKASKEAGTVEGGKED